MTTRLGRCRSSLCVTGLRLLSQLLQLLPRFLKLLLQLGLLLSRLEVGGRSTELEKQRVGLLSASFFSPVIFLDRSLNCSAILERVFCQLACLDTSVVLRQGPCDLLLHASPSSLDRFSEQEMHQFSVRVTHQSGAR